MSGSRTVSEVIILILLRLLRHFQILLCRARPKTAEWPWHSVAARSCGCFRLARASCCAATTRAVVIDLSSKLLPGHPRTLPSFRLSLLLKTNLPLNTTIHTTVDRALVNAPHPS